MKIVTHMFDYLPPDGLAVVNSKGPGMVMHDAPIVIRAGDHNLRGTLLVKVEFLFGYDVVPEDVNKLVPVQW